MGVNYAIFKLLESLYIISDIKQSTRDLGKEIPICLNAQKSY